MSYNITSTCKGYFLEAIATIIWSYVLKDFSEQLNELKVDVYGITTMEKFAGTTTDITLKITTPGAVQFMSCMQYYKST